MIHILVLSGKCFMIRVNDCVLVFPMSTHFTSICDIALMKSRESGLT